MFEKYQIWPRKNKSGLQFSYPCLQLAHVNSAGNQLGDFNMDLYDQDGIRHLSLITSTLSSAEPYEFLVKLRNITWETNYVIVRQNALGTFCQPSISPPPPSPPLRRAPLNVLYYPYIIPTNDKS